MHRYVFKRVRDTFEYGINVRKSFACHRSSGSENKAKLNNNSAKENEDSTICLKEVNFIAVPQQRINFDDFKKKYNCKHPNSCNPFLQAITWSTALIAGFYASQLLCLYRRNQRLDPKKCFYAKYLHHKNKLLHRKFLCAQQAKSTEVQNRSLAPKTLNKFSCPLKKIKSEQKQTDERNNHRKDDDQGTDSNQEFAHFNLFDKRFERFFRTDDDLIGGGHKKVFYNVNNEDTLKDTLNNNKNASKEYSSSGDKNNDKETRKVQNEDEAIDEIMSNLSEMIGELEFQMGVECILHRNYEEAIEHFRMSSSSNNASAYFNLALLYEQGLGVKKDLKVAMKLYEMASDQGHDKALYNMGVYFARGLGGAKKSFKKAKMYFEKAALNGNYDAKEALSLLVPEKKRLSIVPDDFIVADDIVTDLVAQNINYPKNLHSIAVT